MTLWLQVMSCDPFATLLSKYQLCPSLWKNSCCLKGSYPFKHQHILKAPPERWPTPLVVGWGSPLWWTTVIRTNRLGCKSVSVAPVENECFWLFIFLFHFRLKETLSMWLQEVRYQGHSLERLKAKMLFLERKSFYLFPYLVFCFFFIDLFSSYGNAKTHNNPLRLTLLRLW
jgi:hypothetical protein